jgi:hypothetical protein
VIRASAAASWVAVVFVSGLAAVPACEFADL